MTKARIVSAVSAFVVVWTLSGCGASNSPSGGAHAGSSGAQSSGGRAVDDGGSIGNAGDDAGASDGGAAGSATSSAGDGGGAGADGASLSVGPAGDTLSAAGVELIVPAGALPEETTFSISVLSDYPELASDWELRSEVILLEPHGVSFLKPVSLTLPFRGDTVEELQMITTGAGGTWEIVEGASFIEGVARAELRHFSPYAIVAKKTFTPRVFTEHVYVPDQTERAVYVYDIGPGASDQPSRVIRGPKTKIENVESLVVDKFGAVFVVDFDRDIKVFAPGANGDVEPFFTFASGVHPRSITNASNPTVVGWTKSNELYDATVYLFNDPYQKSAPGALVGSFAYPNVSNGWSWSPSGPYGCAARYSSGAGCMKVPTPGPPLLCPAPDIQQCLGDQGSGDFFQLLGRGLGQPDNGVRFRPDGKLTMAWTHPNTVATYELSFDAAPGYANLKLSSSLTGPSTGLDEPSAADFDEAGNMYVVNTGRGSWQGTVTVYPPDSDGDVAPTRTLGQLNSPFGVAVGP